MCVIMLVREDNKRPTREMIQQAWDHNNHGFGMAFRRPSPDDGEPEVVWKKGYMKSEHLDWIYEQSQELPVPYVFHFRIASIGAQVPQLTHPFPISERVPLTLSGRTKGWVLFHNGTYKDWQDSVLKAALASGVGIPTGIWSDTRALAWLCYVYGNGFMEFLPSQKGVAFGPGPDDLDFFTGSDGWKKVPLPNGTDSIWCSNDYFVKKATGGVTVYSGSSFCKSSYCGRKDLVGNTGFCPVHSVSSSTTDNKVSNAGSSGGSQQVTPFPEDNQRPVVSLELARQLHTAGKLPKGKLKDIVQAYERLNNPKTSGKKRRGAQRQLEHISRSLILSGLQVSTQTPSKVAGFLPGVH